MVCRDSKTHKAHQVNPLVIETPEDQQLWRMGEGAPCGALLQGHT